MSDVAFLRYGALGLGDTRRVMERSYYGFKTLYMYLDRTRQYLQRPENIARTTWTVAQQPSRDSDPWWLQLEEPLSASDHDALLFERFFDEYSWVHEAPPDGHRARLSRETQVDVIERDTDRRRLLVARLPAAEHLVVKPNTYIVDQHLRALQRLQNVPQPEHIPLLRLVQPLDEDDWPTVLRAAAPLQWRVLTDATRPGTLEQRQFVEKALATPDFAVLEGPPGSGKTTTICELVLQLVMAGKRVLVCASTHVAVDNVLERLVHESNPHRDEIIAVRIGDRAKCSDRVRHLRLEDRVTTERDHLIHHLRSVPEPTLAQETLLRDLQRGDRAHVERLILDVANVVCGTTIGILQHPDIKRSADRDQSAPLFDVLIVDEASKTTLQEFLVPAVRARRWILVGDVRQLSPHVDAEEIAAALLPIGKEYPAVARAGADVLGLRRGDVTTVAVRAPDEDWALTYREQADIAGVDVTHVDDADDARQLAGLVLCSEQVWQRLARRPPPNVALRDLTDNADGIGEWAHQLSWRLSTVFQQRLTPGSRTIRALEEEVDCLLPPEASDDGMREEVERIRRVAMPSILESLQSGLGSDDDRRNPATVLTHGMPTRALEQRHELLRFQFRMHPDISAFPRERIYEGEALNDVPTLAAERTWDYSRFAARAVWLDARDIKRKHEKRSTVEAKHVAEEVAAFHGFAERTRRPWSVAVLCFYRDQERECRTHLRQLTGQHGAYRYFRLGTAPAVTAIDLCTVDGFQGQEADLVLLTIGLPRTTSFTRSINRVNVAITRAKYQLVVIGDRTSIARQQPSLLQELARTLSVDFGWEPSK